MRPILGFVGLLLCATPAYADAPFHLHIDTPTDADCPSAGAIARELAALLPQLVLSYGGDTAPDSPVAIISFTPAGDGYRVDLGEAHRSFIDVANRCADRARTIAVFLAMTLPPASIELAPVAPDAPLLPTLPPHLERNTPTARLNPLLRASIAVWSASLAMTAIGVLLYERGVVGVSKITCVYSGSKADYCYGYNATSAAYARTGLGIAIAGGALGLAVGIPLTAVGARRNRGLHRTPAPRLAPTFSSTNVGLAAVGTF